MITPAMPVNDDAQRATPRIGTRSFPGFTDLSVSGPTVSPTDSSLTASDRQGRFGQALPDCPRKFFTIVPSLGLRPSARLSSTLNQTGERSPQNLLVAE